VCVLCCLVGYSFGQIPASLVAERLGSKTTFGFAIIVPCLLTLLVPSAAHTSFSLLLALRALIGLAQAATFPSIYHFYPRWVPKAEKTKMISFSHSGMYLGEIIGFGVSGGLINTKLSAFGGLYQGWEIVFFVFGLVGILWFPLFWWRVYDTPEEHPHISTDELLLIRATEVPSGEERDGLSDDDVKAALLPSAPAGASSEPAHSRQASCVRHRSTSSSFLEALADGMSGPALEEGGGGGDEYEEVETTKKRGFEVSEIPWAEIATNPVTLTLFFNHFTYGWIGYMMLTEMPAFLTDALGFDLESAGLLSIVPYFANFISVMAFGWFFDYLQVERKWAVRDIRQGAERVAFMGAGGCLLACGFISEPLVAYSFMVLALWCFGAIQSGISCAYLEVSPNFSNIMNSKYSDAAGKQ
jgi:MFS family permease